MPTTGVGAASTALWTGSGPGTTTVVSDGSTSPPQFSYAMDPAGFDTQTWQFSTTAPGAVTVPLGYHYNGFHAYFDVIVFLTAFVVHDGVETDTPLVNDGPAICCTPPSAGFDYTGSVSLAVQGGDTYGFKFGGSNFDSTNVLEGTLTVTRADDQLATLLGDSHGKGPGTSLADKVNLAAASWNQGDLPDTCIALSGYVAEVKAQSGKSLTTANAVQLAQEAQAIATAIGC